MYQSPRGLVVGFHGCDEAVARRIVENGAPFEWSRNSHDWLGHGVYFWEGDQQRALEWAKEQAVRRKDGYAPFVIGAVIDLRACLNLLDREHLELVRGSHEALQGVWDQLPGTTRHENKVVVHGEPMRRELDCAVIEYLHTLWAPDLEFTKGRVYDSVRGMFPEGEALYAGAGFKDKNHIQICVRNPNCILGTFHVRNPDVSWPSA